MRLLAAALISLGVVAMVEVAYAAPSIPGAANRVIGHDLRATPRGGVYFIVVHDSWPVPVPRPGYGAGLGTAQGQSGGGTGAEWWVLGGEPGGNRQRPNNMDGKGFIEENGVILHSTIERVTGHCGITSPWDHENNRRRVEQTGDACNRHSVGIEVEGYYAHTREQVQSALALIRFLQHRYCIPSRLIFAHGKDPARREGKEIADAARAMNYNPTDCRSTPLSSAGIPGDIITRAVVQSGQNPPSLRDIVSALPPSSVSTYGPYTPLISGLQNILSGFTGTSAFPPYPTTPVVTPQTQSATTLANIAYPSLSTGEETPESTAAAKAAQQQEKTLKIVISAGSTTTITPPSHSTTKIPDVVTVTKEYVTPSTFPSPNQPQNVPASIQNAPSATYTQLVGIWTRVRDILTTLVGYLSGNR